MEIGSRVGGAEGDDLGGQRQIELKQFGQGLALDYCPVKRLLVAEQLGVCANVILWRGITVQMVGGQIQQYRYRRAEELGAFQLESIDLKDKKIEILGLVGNQ